MCIRAFLEHKAFTIQPAVLHKLTPKILGILTNEKTSSPYVLWTSIEFITIMIQSMETGVNSAAFAEAFNI